MNNCCWECEGSKNVIILSTNEKILECFIKSHIGLKITKCQSACEKYREKVK